MTAEKKNRITFYLFLFLTITWMIVIFVFSSQNAEKSTDTSHYVGMIFGKIFVPGFKELSSDKQFEFAAQIDYPVRKTAHACAFGLIGFFSFMTVFFFARSRGKAEKKRIWIYGLSALAFSVAYAASDEFHQLFVPGRAGKITDVLIDGSGALVFILFSILFINLIERKKTISGSEI